MHFTREQREAWEASTRDSPFNRWLRDRTTGASGELSLELLGRVAAEYGVDHRAYAHLNAGQQRMNVGNRLRKLVPIEVYSVAGATEAGPACARPLAATSAPAADGPRSELATATDRELLRLHGAVLDELRARGVVRTANAPLGDYAEHLFAKAFGWTLAGNSERGHDATDAAGLRFQVKARRLRTGTPGERQLSVIRALPDAKFEMLAAVLFDRSFKVFRAALIPHAIVLKRSSFVAHVNGWRLILDDAVLSEPAVRDVTLPLAAAAG